MYGARMEKKKRISNFIFSIVFVAVLIIPFCMINTEPTITSTLENRNMTEWPGLHFSSLYNEWYGHYAEDRVGFRNQAIAFNNYVTYYLFDAFAEQIHMNGKDGYVFPADEGYVQNYQRIDINEPLLEDLAGYFQRTSEYAEENGVSFYAFVCPNKSSVYGQYMPDTIHVDEAKDSPLELLKKKLCEKGVNYVIPDREFIEKSKTEQIYNYKYDSAHWNDLGALYGLALLDEKIAEKNPDIPIISKDYFDLTYEDVNLELFSIAIKDTIPHLTYRGPAAVNSSDSYKEAPVLAGHNMGYFYNENAQSDKSVLILHDSFLDDRECYYYSRYKEVYFCARTNYIFMKEYIDQIHPDVIIFELAERSFADDLPAYTELGTYTFE